ncbi:MAG: hypothetical protein M3O31_10760 [Acidobacteriota bacterium]|nr:hypothetical protein [Acidobacteriota bacterium]
MKKTAGKNAPFDPAFLPHLVDLIDYGEITVGVLEPVGCVATAVDGHDCLAMLVRRDGETLAQLLTRLALAVGLAFAEDIFTEAPEMLVESWLPSEVLYRRDISGAIRITRSRIQDYGRLLTEWEHLTIAAGKWPMEVN